MQPILNIEQVRSDRFIYSLGAAQPAMLCDDNLFDSIERCLHDAGESLAGYFKAVSICYAGVPLATLPIDRLRIEPVRVGHELDQRWRDVNRVSACGKP